MKPPRYLNEWMDNLLITLDKNDKATSQISAFMHGLACCQTFDKIKSIELAWVDFGINVNFTIKPKIRIEFK